MMRMPLLLPALLSAAPLLAVAQQTTVGSPSPVAVQDKTQPSPRLNPAVSERAENLSGHLVRDLHLNAYQADRTRQINLDYTAKLAAVEREQAGNPAEAARQTAALDQAREKAYQDLYTTDQYTSYFDSRRRYAQLDRDYATHAAAANLQNAIQHPQLGRTNNAVIQQAQPGGTSRNRPAVRQ